MTVSPPALYWYQLTTGTLAPTYWGQLDTCVRDLCTENSITPQTAPWYSTIAGTLNSAWILQVDARVRLLCTALSVTPPTGTPVNLIQGTETPNYYASLDACVRNLCTASGGYVAPAVHFNGQTYLTSNTDLGVVDSPLGIFSIWVKQANQGDLGSIWGAFVDMESDRWLNIHPTNDDVSGGFAMGFGTTPTSFAYVNYYADEPFFDVATWDHILISWNLNFAIGSKRLAVYLNRVLQPNDIALDALNAFSIGFQNEKFWIGTIGGQAPSIPGPALTGDVADEYLNIGHTIVQADSTILSADLDKFITAGLKPVDLGADGSTPTGTVPSFFLHGTATTFADNAAGTGAFTLHGDALTNATSPSA